MKASIFAGLIAAFASLAAAYTTPTEQKAGAVNKPGAQEIVPVGKPYTISWVPTSKGTVTIVLLRGPGENIKPLYPIVEKAPNTGSYSWNPSTELEDDVTHYGIQLIEDDTGYYQYTTQFGVENKNPGKPSTPAEEEPVKPSTPAEEPVYTTPVEKAPKPTPEVPAGEESISYSTHYATLTSCDCTETPTYAPTGPAGTGYVDAANSTIYTIPTNTAPATSVIPPPAEYTGAASQLKVGGALVAVVAAMAFLF